MKYDLSDNLNSSFHVEADTLNLMLQYDIFYVFPFIENTKT